MPERVDAGERPAKPFYKHRPGRWVAKANGPRQYYAPYRRVGSDEGSVDLTLA